MKSWSLTFATQMLFRRSGSKVFRHIQEYYSPQNISTIKYSWKMLRKLKWQIPGEPLAARYNWCLGPVPGRGSAVEKHCAKTHSKGGQLGGLREPQFWRQLAEEPCIIK